MPDRQDQPDRERAIIHLWTGFKRLVQRQQLPKTYLLTDFDRNGVRFEVTNMVERYRVVDHGGETSYLMAMLEALRDGDVLYDIGANVGLVALHAARRCRTVAFEPDPSFMKRLTANLRLNPDLNITVMPIAISNSDGKVVLYTDGATGNSPSLVHQRGEKDSVDVQARSLDSLMGTGELPMPTVLKLDIEGAEILALRGASRMFHHDAAPRALFLEVHDALLPAFGSSGDEVLGLVRDAGYTEVRYEGRRRDERHLILERAVGKVS